MQPPQPATVHIERVELNAGLRVAGDDASDGARKKRAKKHEFEKWERLKARGDVNIVQGTLHTCHQLGTAGEDCISRYTLSVCFMPCLLAPASDAF